MELQDLLNWLPFIASLGTIIGIIVVSRYPDRPFSVPLARATLLTGAGFMFWLGWMCFTNLPDRPWLNWTCIGLCLACTVLFGGSALFGRGEAVLRNIQEMRDPVLIDHEYRRMK